MLPRKCISSPTLFKTSFSVIAVAVLVLAGSLLAAPDAQAAPGINQTINFQGKLANPNGTNLANGTYSVVFALYTASSGGSPIWTETQNVTTTAGLFRISLGSVDTLSGVNFNQDSLYLGMTVESDSEMSPRLQFSAVPYAFNAKQVNGLSVTNNGGNSLNIAANKGLTVSNTLTLTGVDSSSINFGSGGTVCYTDASCVTADSLDFSHLADSMSLDVSTSINLGSNNLSLAGTGQVNFAHTGLTTFAGDVSIGTHTATTKLDVDGLIRVRNPQGETAAPTRTNNGEFAFANVSSEGRLYFRTNGADYYINSSGTGDYSEYFLKSDPAEKFPVGMITSLEDGRLRKTQANSQVLGVVSAFGTRGNDSLDGERHQDKKYANVGLMGQLPVLVSSEQGAIPVGQKIGHPQAIAGVGVKSQSDQSWLAIAMQAFNPSASCPTVSSIAAINWPKEVKNHNPDNVCFTLPSGTVIGRIMAYISPSTANGQAATTQALVTAMGLNADNTQLSTSLDLSVNGTLRAQGGLIVGGPAEFQGPAIFKAIAEFIDTVIFRNNVTFERDVAIDGTLWLNKDTAGLARINPGQKTVRITFDGQYEDQPVVSTSLNDTTVTTEAYQAYITSGLCDIANGPAGCQDKLRQALLSQDVRFIIAHQDNTGFTVELEKPTQQQLTFSWIALMVKDKKTVTNP